MDRKSFGLPKYIRKLDFINSFIKPQSEWFVQEDLIIELLTKKNKNLNDDEDEYDQDDLNLDPYEYYKEHGHNKNADLVRILEGKKADQEAKQYICNTYPHIENIIDYDLKDYKGDFASAYSDTIENLKKHKQAIMFQPVFIYNDIAIAKPDALIKDGDQLIIIETKCTPKCKPLHLIDITYQYQLINAVLKNNNHKPINHAFFCLVKYALLLKNQIGFTLTPYCALKNNDPGNATKNLSYIEKINIKSAYKLAINLDLKIIDALRLKIKNDGNSNIDAYIKINQTVLTRIEELYKALTTFKPHLPKFTPSLTYQNWFGCVNYFPELRTYFSNNYDLFSYTGRLIRYKTLVGYFNSSCNDFTKALRSEIKDSKKKSEKNSYHQTFLNFLENNHPNAITNSHLNSVSFTTSIISSFKKLRLKKVYFDFETINLATRIVDNTLPFEQIVNQVSIIIDDGDGVTAKTKCENILFDPQAINEKSFKQIVDKILPSKNLNECGQYHYIVYNKSFEKSRLKAIDEYLSQNSIDRSYHNKINIICDNLFDLADFFNIYNVKDGYLYVKQLHGYYSIKRILPIVEKFAPKIFSLTGCKNYKKDLKINNGSDASETASLRFLNRISNAEWKKIAIDLKAYCENDVRAMVAVEYFIRYTLRSTE